MQGLRFASSPRVWAKSKQHGPTNYDGPNPTPRKGARLRAHYSDERRVPGRWFPLCIAAVIWTVGFHSTMLFDATLVGWERLIIWCPAGVAALAAIPRPARRLEFLALLLAIAFPGTVLICLILTWLGWFA